MMAKGFGRPEPGKSQSCRRHRIRAAVHEPRPSLSLLPPPRRPTRSARARRDAGQGGGLTRRDFPPGHALPIASNRFTRSRSTVCPRGSAEYCFVEPMRKSWLWFSLLSSSGSQASRSSGSCFRCAARISPSASAHLLRAESGHAVDDRIVLRATVEDDCFGDGPAVGSAAGGSREYSANLVHAAQPRAG